MNLALDGNHQHQSAFGSVGRLPNHVTNDSDNELRQIENDGVPTMAPSDSRTVFDAELGAEIAQLLTAWPTLPATMRQGILALIQSVGSTDSKSR